MFAKDLFDKESSDFKLHKVVPVELDFDSEVPSHSFVKDGSKKDSKKLVDFDLDSAKDLDSAIDIGLKGGKLVG